MSIHHLISADDYNTWVANWKRQEHTTESYSFFKQGDKVQTGAIFPFHSLRYLLSAVGVITIKIRFGLREFADGRPAQFHPILFGVDGTNTIITPYFTASAFTHHHHYQQQGEGEGNLPQALMEEWKKSWHKHAFADDVDHRMFCVNPQLPADKQGLLQGYNYLVKELMDALGTFKGAASMHVKFGLHEYYSLLPGATDEPTRFHTFGLMLYAATIAKASSAGDGDGDKEAAPTNEEVVDESGYYDLSAPCPFTC